MDEKKGGYYTEARARANRKYMEKYVEVKVRMTPEQRNTVQAHAQQMGESATVFINRAINETMERDNADREATEA
jgi:hypothetical protein